MSRVRTFSAQGFRGFALEQSLEFRLGSAPANVAVFGENGAGKSSFADAVEFLFSDKGVIDRLGERASENQAGTQALLHRGTLRNGLPALVQIELDDGQTLSRTVSTNATSEALPTAVRAIRETAPVPFVLRSTEMRTFVADKKGKERYAQLAHWIGLEKLTGIQDALTRIDNKLSAENRVEAKNEHQRALTKLTGGAVTTWNGAALIDWVNASVLQKFDDVRLGSMDELETVESAISQREFEEGRRQGVEDLRVARDAIEGLLPGSGRVVERLHSSAAELRAATSDEEDLRSRMETAPLGEVWSAVRDYLKATPSQTCPACLRPFEPETTREAVLASLDDHLARLTGVADAKARTRRALSAVRREIQSLESQLQNVIRLTKSLADVPLVQLRDSAATVLGALPPEDDRGSELSALEARLEPLSRLAKTAAAHTDDRVDQIKKRFEIPYQQKLAELRRLREIRDEWARLAREERELSRILEQFRTVADVTLNRVHAHVTQILGGLQEDVRDIYAALRRNDDHLPVVDVVVEKKSMSVVLDLFGEKRMVPSSYLSDSQLNSLGLALYLAAARRFNKSFPFMVLDDVMSSYDGSHRLNLIDVIGGFLPDFQLLVTTHDEPFYRQSRSILSHGGRWRFHRLQRWTFSRGIRVRHDGTTAEELKRLINEGEPANVLSQVIISEVEDWLLLVCADAGIEVAVKIRRDGSTGDATMKDLWNAAQRCFDATDRAHPSYAVLAGHGMLNWPRHSMTASTMTVTASELQTFFDHYARFRAHHETRKAT